MKEGKKKGAHSHRTYIFMMVKVGREYKQMT
jgi:hypothetical protein